MNSKVILVIDNDIESLKIYHQAFDHDYQLVIRSSGEEGLKYVKDHPTDLIILELMLPQMSGEDFLIQKNEDPFVANIPVIVASASINKDNADDILSHNVIDFLIKPLNAEAIGIRTRNALRWTSGQYVMAYDAIDRQSGLYMKEYFKKRSEDILSKEHHRRFNIFVFGIDQYDLIKDIFGDASALKLVQITKLVLLEHISEIRTFGIIDENRFVLMTDEQIDPENIIRKFEDDLDAYQENIQLNYKFGIYRIHDTDEEMDEMINKAKLAFDEAVKSVRNYAYYRDRFMEVHKRRQIILNDLSRGIKNHEFEVYYQAKYDLKNEMIAGAEALIRWNHPTLGFLTPDEFIPVYEENGYITFLDMYVWEEVAKELASMRERGLPLVPISVNVSRKDLYQPHLVMYFRSLIVKYKLDVRYFHLEITESAYMDDSKQLLDTLAQLKTYDFVLEMDDFGSGYSSLTMLSDMPINIIKLDGHFMQHDKSSNIEIISFIISLAHWMGYEVVAEGVENALQVELLKNLDCDYVQGYYYSKPVKVKAFERLLIKSLGKSGSLVHINAVQSKKTILIADDLEVDRAILKEIFKDDFEVAEAENGKIALAYIKEHEQDIAIILTDIIMPVMDGFELIAALRSEGLCRDVPIIIISKFSREFSMRASKYEVYDFLEKPFDPGIAKQKVMEKLVKQNIVKDQKQRRLQREMDVYISSFENSALLSSVISYQMSEEIIKVLYLNKSFQQLIGYQPQEITKNAYKIFDHHELEAFKVALRQAAKNKTHFEINLHIYPKMGNLILLKLLCIYIYELNSENFFCLIIDDISSYEKQMNLLKKEATRDFLTGCLNRKSFQTEVEKSLTKPFGVLCIIDIDDFSYYNKELGHRRTNQIVASAGQYLNEEYDLVGSFDGDKFGLFIDDANQIEEKLEDLKISLTSKVQPLAPITFSIGAAVIKTNEEISFYRLFDEASDALKEAKDNGKDRIVIHEI